MITSKVDYLYSLDESTCVVPVGPIAVTCTITSPDLAHAKCGCFGRLHHRSS